MAKNDDPVTLEMTWGAVHAAAKENDCSIQELSNRQVKKHMPHGSDGCVAAFFRQIRIQDIDAKAFDITVFSPAFKASIVSEIRRFVDNAVGIAHQEARVTEQMFDEVCKDLDAAQETISSLRGELEDSKSKSQEEVRRLETEIAAVKEKLTSMEEVKRILAEGRDAATRGQDKAREEANRLQVNLAEATQDLSSEKSRASSLQDRLAVSEREREEAVQKAALAEQRAAHAKAMAEECKGREQELRAELVQTRADYRDLERRHADVLGRVGQLEARAVVAEAQLRSPGGKKKPPSGSDMSKDGPAAPASPPQGGNGKGRS